jgi:hypothetical protein
MTYPTEVNAVQVSPTTGKLGLTTPTQSQLGDQYRTALLSIRDRINANPFNVKDYGALGDGSTNDTTAINACIAASTSGSTVFFPTGTYIVNATISLPSNRAYAGATRRDSVVKMANAANIDAVMASAIWLDTTLTPTSDPPITVKNLGIDANRANQTSGLGHCLVLMNYYSTAEALELSNPRGDALRWTTTTRANHLVSNTMVENHIINVQANNPGTGIGIHVEDSSFSKLTDGWITDCAVNMQGSGGDCIFVDSAAGWNIHGNHVYGGLATGLNINRPVWTRVTNNYVEAYGGSATLQTQYAGIAMGENRQTWIATAGWNIVANNTINFTTNNTSADNIGISVYAASSGTGEVVLVGNGMDGVAGRTYGIYLSNQSSTGTLRVHLAGNRVSGWSTPYSAVSNSGSLTTTGPDVFPQVLATTATDGYDHMPTVAGTPTGVPADLTAGMPFVYDTTNHRLYFYEASAWHYIARTA